jgi:hypothetical protein
MWRAGTAPAERLWLHCGPAICGECYEVGSRGARGRPPRPRAAHGQHPHRPARRHRAARRARGLAAEQVSFPRHCTLCGEPTSSRTAAARRGRQMAGSRASTGLKFPLPVSPSPPASVEIVCREKQMLVRGNRRGTCGHAGVSWWTAPRPPRTTRRAGGCARVGVPRGQVRGLGAAHQPGPLGGVDPPHTKSTWRSTSSATSSATRARTSSSSRPTSGSCW